MRLDAWPGPAPTTGALDSAAARARLIAFVDDTLRAATGGAEVRDEEPAREPDVCGDGDEGHHWTYSKWIAVSGVAVQEQFVAEVKAYWERAGRTITSSDKRRWRRRSTSSSSASAAADRTGWPAWSSAGRRRVYRGAGTPVRAP